MAKLGIAVMLVTVLAVVASVRAQDGPELEQRVEALETRVAALEGDPTAAPVGTPRADGEGIVLHGRGSDVTPPFFLPAGTVVMALESDATSGVATLSSWPDGDVITFVALWSDPSASGLARIPAAGDYVVEVVTSGPWTVTIELPE